MKLPLLLLLIQSCALVARATPARHWRRAPTHGVFNVDVYAYNKPRMNLVRRQAIESRSTQDAPPLDHMLQQISHHSRRSTEQRSHYRNLDEDMEVLPMPIAVQEQPSELNKTIESPAINMQLMPLQMNTAMHARENLYSNEFHVQSVGTKKIVQLNTLTIDHERKPVDEEVMTQKQQEQEQQVQQEPLKMKLTLPELAENNAEAAEVLPARNKVKEVNAAGTAPAGEPVTSVKKPMAPSETIIDKPSTGMQQVVSPTTAENADDTGTMAQSGKRKKDEPKGRPPRPKSKRKQKPTGGAPASNETEIKMTANRVVTASLPGALRPETPETNPIRGPGTGPLNAKQPTKELATQSLSPEISTHRPLTTKSGGKGKGKGKGKDKRRQGSQRRPAIAGAMEEEIETTTNWWQILPYTEIRKFLNTIYDTIADDGDDERATVDV
ncbi:uncharacterized protein LOC6530747 [Drosophila yakuba]|uniref:Uncharacterized protein n=1 Tax=Drosophila yakuba TaxID=7245 RepID=B4PA18_DROYA|nr:uncharacterized protein LOC6530747 [Drosophila yakuba]EDW91349.1 uncharacterized protein Dyak_GE12140 [Drosophila yakuba]